MPLTVSDGEELRIGEASVKVEGRLLMLRDLYTKKEFRLQGNVEVRVEPNVPVHVPKQLTSCVLLKLNPPSLLQGVKELRLTAPYELRVVAGSEVVGYLSPFAVKYTVIGTPSEGVICRFHPSEVIDGLPLGVEAFIDLGVSEEGPSLIEGVVLEDVVTVPMKYEVGEGRFFVAYGPVKTTRTGKFLLVPARTALSSLGVVLKSAANLNFLRGP
ncbi:MAG: DUF432 domain-containing protein [Desulfurococcales archaeon]|nr:DUF432 domain-containing protein [Desulfurococcales archaeon]